MATKRATLFTALLRGAVGPAPESASDNRSNYEIFYFAFRKKIQQHTQFIAVPCGINYTALFSDWTCDNKVMMSGRNLLLCFDAFGTLFKPKQPIAQQYGDVARSLGLKGFTDEQLQASFRAAFKQESRDYPNYGQAAGLDAKKWWTNVITHTFNPLVGQSRLIEDELAPRLLYRFSSSIGYTTFPDVLPLLTQLPKSYSTGQGRVVVGVITNSDDRVPAILTSLGLHVSLLRYGAHAPSLVPQGEQFDIDFSVMSYDVGAEKPDRRIFRAAEEMLESILNSSGDSLELESWRRVYIGDDYEKDILGAVQAGWNAVYIDRESTNRHGKQIVWLDDRQAQTLSSAFQGAKAVGFSNLAAFARWLPSERATPSVG